VPDGARDDAAIRRLVFEYARLIDAADFDRFARLFRHATWLGRHGHAAVCSWLEANIITYDGATLTEHVVSNVVISINADGRRAAGTCDITVHQRLPGRDPILVTSNSYADTFVRDGTRWRFASRDLTRREPGNDSWHRR
jgi:hypothetical protein